MRKNITDKEIRTFPFLFVFVISDQRDFLSIMVLVNEIAWILNSVYYVQELDGNGKFHNLNRLEYKQSVDLVFKLSFSQ